MERNLSNLFKVLCIPQVVKIQGIGTAGNIFWILFRNFACMKEKEQIVYVEFYLAGDKIFSCQKAWLPKQKDIDLKRADLADLNGVETSLITTSEVITEYPVSKTILSELLEGTGVCTN